MISDIHVGTSVKEHQIDNMLEKINEQNPDIVCLAGDIFDENSSDEMIEYLCEALGKIEVKYGIYYITGNHDGNMKDKFSDKFEKYNIYIIDEKAILINDSFYLVGRADDVTGNRGSVENILQGINKEYPIILLDHRPVNINEAENSGVDLQLSGHTHNGQIYPFNYFVGLANDVSYGHKKYGNYNIIVSSGYGTWGFPVRTGSSAEIVKVVLQGKS
jgi:predicted MPP superfamily phosphohydrolase